MCHNAYSTITAHLVGNMLNKLKTWWRRRRLKAAKQVLVRYYIAEASRVGLSPAQTHQFMLRCLRAIADAHFTPAGLTPVETNGRPLRDALRARQVWRDTELKAGLEMARRTPKGDHSL